MREAERMKSYDVRICIIDGGAVGERRAPYYGYSLGVAKDESTLQT